MSGWRKPSTGLAVAAAAVLTLAACGSGARQDANEKSGIYHVSVTSSFPSSQFLAQSSNLVISVRNVDTKTIPDVAVTICNVTCGYTKQDLQSGYGTSVQAFSEKITYPQGVLASDSRPVWIVDQAPNPNANKCGYSCQQGGPGGAVTAYSNTWALGSLKPNQTATFQWKVTAVKSGMHIVAWQVAAGLNGKAKARTSTGALPQGTFAVKISNAPQQAYVNNSGKIVTTP